jgi:DNA polymerase-1
MEKKTLYLLDGHALVYRAHYAFINRPLINSKGINTSAITGFTRTLWDLIQNKKPSHIAVSFDPKGGTFRNEFFPEYKANRDAQPEDITIALPYIKKILEAFKIPILTIDNYEADDVIGTLAKQAEKEGFNVFMVTPDKDFGQLVSENIFMYKPSRQGNGVDIWGEKEVTEIWGIDNVLQVIDMLGLQGDSVDNIPGVPGIGPKTASKLLAIYGSMENLLDHAEELKGKQRENLINFADQARLSKELATIKLDVPVQFEAKKFKIDPFDRKSLSDVFKELEFRTLATSILGDAPVQGTQSSLFPIDSTKTQSKTAETKSAEYKVVEKTIENSSHHYIFVDSYSDRKKLIEYLSKQKAFAFDTETTGLDSHQAELVGLSFSCKAGEAYYVPVPADQNIAKRIVAEFKGLMERPDIMKIGQNLKYDINILKWYNVHVQGEYFDTMVAHYLLEPDLRHKLDYLSESYLGYKMVPIEKLIGKRGVNQLNMRDIDPQKVSDYAAEDADITFQLKEYFLPLLKEQKLTDLFDQLEMPLVKVLSSMEYEGVRINKEFLDSYSEELGSLIVEKENEIYEEAGVRFNIASPKQVGEVLFDKLKVPYRWRKTASGQYSTSEEKLTELAKNHEIINNILQFRKYSKLKSTYVDALPLMINPRTGRVHSSFNQARAATGRLSSENPNLQNIPIKDKAGREIRKAFQPRDEEHVLLAADYSQIELRLIAEISKDEAMLNAFQAGHDIHKATAAGVYGVKLEEVTAEQRRNAKTVNFSIIYGAGSTNLSRQLNIKRTEAKVLIENYFKQYTGLKNYMESTVDFAREHGYVNTLKGRKRFLRDINSRNGLARSNAERMAINTPIQGTAADMIKIAMINIHHKMKTIGYKSKMVLQVHDELVFDVYNPELAEIKKLVESEMKNAMPGLKVPILVDVGVGTNWLEAH